MRANFRDQKGGFQDLAECPAMNVVFYVQHCDPEKTLARVKSRGVERDDMFENVPGERI